MNWANWAPFHSKHLVSLPLMAASNSYFICADLRPLNDKEDHT